MGTSGQEDTTLCPVCGYTAEGNHYGILSCRSCASFFKRVVEKGDSFDRHPMPQPGVPYNYCNIRENRNSCKQCRYLRCLETGMQTTAVQPRREPTGSQANRKRKTLLNQTEALTDNIQSLSVSSLAEGDFYSSASASPAPTRTPSVPRLYDQPNSYADYGRTYQYQDLGRRDRTRPQSTESFSPSKRLSGQKVGEHLDSDYHRTGQHPYSYYSNYASYPYYPNYPSYQNYSYPFQEDFLDSPISGRESKENKSGYYNRLSSFDSGDGDGDSSNDSSRPQLAHSTRSSSERFLETLEDNEDEYEEINGIQWIGRRMECPACPPDTCNAGLTDFMQLIQAFADHTRQMQLSFTSIEDYIKESTKGIALREMEPADINKLSNVELAGLLFWVEKMGHFNAMAEEDQMNLIKRYSVRKLSLDHFYSASKYRDHAKLRSFVLNNYTFVPADKTGFETPSEDNRQREAKFEIFKHTFERFWINVIDKFIRMNVGDPEIVFLHFMLMWSPLNNQFVNDDTKRLLQSRRNWAMQMIFEYYHHKQQPDAELRVGELINLYQEIENVVDQHCSDVHVARLFDFCDLSDYWYDHTCYSAINTDKPIDCALDVARLLEMFADLAHNGSEKERYPREDANELFEFEPRRINYNMKGDEPMKIIKWMSGQQKEKLFEIEKSFAEQEERDRPKHIPSCLDFVIPSTRNGKAIYPESVLRKNYRKVAKDTCFGFTSSISPKPSTSSSDVSPEGFKADSPEAYSTEITVERSNDSEVYS